MEETPRLIDGMGETGAGKGGWEVNKLPVSSEMVELGKKEYKRIYDK